MKEEINLESRYREIHKLTRIGDESSLVYKFTPADEFCRVGIIEDNPNQYSFIDPSGGPFISTGSVIDGHKVKSINQTDEGVCIEFEKI